MNKPISLEALRSLAEENSSFARRRRRATTALAAVAMLGVSMTACSSGGSGADAAGADSTADVGNTVEGSTTPGAGTTLTADDATDSGPQFSPSGGPATGPGGQSGPGGQGGTVTAIDGSTITVENQGRDGTTTTLTVETSDDTTVSTTLDGSIDDLAVGDTIVAFGETTDDEFIASSINAGMGAMGGPVFQGGGMPGGDGAPGGDDRPPVFPDGEVPDGSFPERPADAPTGGPGGAAGGPMAGQLVSGTITEIGDSTITVETSDGVETVIAVDDDTMVSVAVEKELSDISVGSTVRVSGDATDDTITATAITITEN